MPGLKKEDIKITVENNRLKISGERKEVLEKTEQQSHYSEIVYGSFFREYDLPNMVDSNGVKANYEGGVLNLTIPKSKESKAKEIRVE